MITEVKTYEVDGKEFPTRVSAERYVAFNPTRPKINHMMEMVQGPRWITDSWSDIQAKGHCWDHLVSLEAQVNNRLRQLKAFERELGNDV